MVAKVIGWMGDEYAQDVQLRRLQGLRRHQEGHESHDQARRRGFRGQEITEFKVLDKVPAETFAEPK